MTHVLYDALYVTPLLSQLKNTIAHNFTRFWELIGCCFSRQVSSISDFLMTETLLIIIEAIKT
jgi:hypothetical protein